MLLWTRAGTSKKFVLARKQTAQRDIQNKETSSLHYWLSSLSLFFYSNIIHAMWLSIVSRLRPIYIICLTAVAEYLHISFYVGLQEPVLCLSITQWNKDRLKRTIKSKFWDVLLGRTQKKKFTRFSSTLSPLSSNSERVNSKGIYRNKIHSIIQKTDLTSVLLIVYESPLALNSKSWDTAKTMVKRIITPVS